MPSSFNGFTAAAQGISFTGNTTPSQTYSFPTTSNVGTTGFDLAQQGVSLSPNSETIASNAANDLAIQGAQGITGGQLRYPNTDWPSRQDYILFTALQYGKKDFNLSQGNIGFTNRNFTALTPTVILPIQSKIQDGNLVQWTSGDMSAIKLAAAGLSSDIIGGKLDLEGTVKSLQQSATDPMSKRAIDLFFAEKASQATGLLSRLEGAIANPNLELLFQGPELRNFSFTFIMSARDSNEAGQIRRIIRFFKQNMAVKRTTTNIFLKSPNVFRVQYKSSTANGLHPSINRIKECALTNLNVDYTPAGTYSTFNDPKSTMTAYSMQMTFQELEPVFADEYRNVPADEIGF